MAHFAESAREIYHIKVATFSRLSGVLIFYQIVVFLIKTSSCSKHYKYNTKYIVLSRQRAPANYIASIYSSSLFSWGAKSLQPKIPPQENSSHKIPPQKNPY